MINTTKQDYLSQQKTITCAKTSYKNAGMINLNRKIIKNYVKTMTAYRL